ncbi:ABC transporter permease [Salisediminibacterium halotolerans]|uniref:ABC transporter permease n=1 Tax=Salisediminibacterium halotolerans TaxID=517425 RepID=UPI000EB058C9|nr:ABC transporter permease subunit [Salisediminibacterium halotolerans]RLJ75626.1 iron(III) transport system permease protein [Actinophytocola xinjiangensis]RPE89480.1 iron(III) transport system permease protein [Salisediminibacterium halotolerans]TWG36239.1 iron(III) transport system permease protein [Salisediminibacterium halotolerans]GEL08275.1 iron ABC transporter permease [Salisediminibacterium halotolerans]
MSDNTAGSVNSPAKKKERVEKGFLAATWGIAALLFLFILAPVLAVLLQSFGIGAGAFTLEHYERFFTHANYLQSLFNSIAAASISTFVIVCLSIPFALYVTRTSTWLSSVYRGIGLLPLVAPPFIFSLSLIILFGRRGVVTQVFNDVTGLEISIYGFWGVVIAQVLGYFPVAYMMIESSMRNINPSVEQASQDLGAGQGRTLGKITLPLAGTAILKAGLIVFVMALADFSNPLIIGGGENFLASDAFLLVTGQQNLEMAAVLGVFLIIPSLLVFLFQTYLLKGHDTATSQSGGANNPLNPRMKRLMFGISTLVALFIVVMFIMVVLSAFVQIIGVNNTFTLDHFADQSGFDFLWNSVVVSFFAALIASGIGILQGYMTARKNVPMKKLMEFTALFGLAVPGTVMGIGYVLIFNGAPFYLTGTIFLLVMNMAFRKVGVGLEAGISKMQQIDPSLEQASQDLGAGPYKTFGRIVVPLLTPAFMAGFVYTFMTAMVSVSSVIFIISPGTNLAAPYILNLADQAAVGRASAMSFILIVIVICCMGLLKLMERKWSINSKL